MSKQPLKVVDAPYEKTALDKDSIQAEASSEFVNSSDVSDITKRALAYLDVGYPIHLTGASGTGKTTLAFHIAAQIGRPITLIHGDDEFGSSDLIGQTSGFKRSRVVDNYISSVMRTEEEYASNWMDNRLTTACLKGFTLIYDEFTRSRPEANNALLCILEEKILNLPKLRRQGDGYVGVHPNFRAIFTSNPQEYIGVHKTQDALMDRLINIRLNPFNRDTEVNVLVAKSGIQKRAAEKIVDIVRELRTIGVNNNQPSVRASIALAKIIVHCGINIKSNDPLFMQTCHDILDMDTANVTRAGESVMVDKIEEVIRKIC